MVQAYSSHTQGGRGHCCRKGAHKLKGQTYHLVRGEPYAQAQASILQKWLGPASFRTKPGSFYLFARGPEPATPVHRT